MRTNTHARAGVRKAAWISLLRPSVAICGEFFADAAGLAAEAIRQSHPRNARNHGLPSILEGGAP